MNYVERLSTIDFFKNIKETYIDRLTQTVSKVFITDYMRYLIGNNEAFAAVKINADNFRTINEYYSEAVGDRVLTQLASVLIEVAGENGVVGRSGGDEFLIIIPGEFTYDELWAFNKNLFDNHIRNANFIIDEETKYILTCTCGAAAYPKDAKNAYEFGLCLDKAVYRGKKKGRNCFICYVEEKHKNIDLNNKKVNEICDNLNELHLILSKDKDSRGKITAAIDYICNYVTIHGGYFICDNEVLIKGRASYSIDGFDANIFKNYFDDNGMVVCNNYSFLAAESREIHDFCWGNKIYSFILSEVKYDGKVIGYLMFVDSLLKRIWQESEKVMVSFVSKAIAYLLKD